MMKELQATRLQLQGVTSYKGQVTLTLSYAKLQHNKEHKGIRCQDDQE